MPPRTRRKIQQSKKILSSSSSSPDNSFLIDKATRDVQMQDLTKSGKLYNSPDLFNLPKEDSPMKSPAKFGDDLLLETPVRRGNKNIEFKTPVLSPLRSPLLLTTPDSKLFFKDYRNYNFISNKTEKLLLIFELNAKVDHACYQPDKLVASLYHVTSPANTVQLNWLQHHIEEIFQFNNYQEFFQWLKNDVKIVRLFPQKYIQHLKFVFQICQIIVSSMINVMMNFVLLFMLLGVIVYFITRSGYINSEMYIYFKIIRLILGLILDSINW